MTSGLPSRAPTITPGSCLHIDREAVGALHERERLPHGREQVAVVVVADQVGEHLGVGVGAERRRPATGVAA